MRFYYQWFLDIFQYRYFHSKVPPVPCNRIDRSILRPPAKWGILSN